MKRSIVLALILCLPAFADEPKSITARTASLKKLDGFIPLYWDEQNGKLLMEISRFGEELIYQTSLPAGLGSNPVGLDRGELSATRDDRDLVMLNGGRSVSGRLVDVRGALDRVRSAPLQFVFRTDAGDERIIPAGRVSRIYLGGFPDNLRSAVGTSGYGGYRQSRDRYTAGNYVQRVTVPGTSDWVDSGVDVNQGDRVYLESRGEIRLSDDPTDVAAVAGSKRQRLAVNSPLPQDLAGALIGRIDGQVFGIGNQTSVVMPRSGRLLLGVNDDEFRDNVGEFTVLIRSIERRR